MGVDQFRLGLLSPVRFAGACDHFAVLFLNQEEGYADEGQDKN